jgi:hypothetical protein
MLTHAFAGNLKTAHLIAGDLDFKPLVDSLVNLGTWVTVWFEPKAGAAELIEAADSSNTLTIDNLTQWSNRPSGQLAKLPWEVTTNLHPHYQLIRTGTTASNKIQLYQDLPNSQFLLCDDLRLETSSRMAVHTDRETLLRFYELQRGKIVWEDAARAA